MRRAKKSLGQNFLRSGKWVEEIVKQVGFNTELLLEIGAGRGALTKDLANRSKNFFILEKDSSLIKELHQLLGERKGLWIWEGDALDFDYNRIFQETGLDFSLVVVSNLPYNIATKILFHLLKYKDKISRMILMFQKEVAERIQASPSSKACAAISIFCQNFFITKLLFNLSPDCFTPRPKVDSSVVLFEKREKPLIPLNEEECRQFLSFLHAGFSHRRKILLNSLSLASSSLQAFSTSKELEKILKELAIDPLRRAETLTIHEWGKLFFMYQSLLLRA